MYLHAIEMGWSVQVHLGVGLSPTWIFCVLMSHLKYQAPSSSIKKCLSFAIAKIFKVTYRAVESAVAW